MCCDARATPVTAHSTKGSSFLNRLDGLSCAFYCVVQLNRLLRQPAVLHSHASQADEKLQLEPRPLSIPSY